MEELQRTSGVTPFALSRRPVQDPKTKPYESAFWVCNHSRIKTSDGPQPLQISEVESFLNIAGIEGQEALKFLRLIQAVDVAYLKHVKK